MTMTNVLLITGIIVSSIGLGYSIGIKQGVEISMKTSIERTIKILAKEFDKLGMKDQFKTIVNKTFDTTNLNLWENEE